MRNLDFINLRNFVIARGAYYIKYGIYRISEKSLLCLYSEKAGLRAAVALIFCAEGDNAIDAINLITYVNSWKDWIDLKVRLLLYFYDFVVPTSGTTNDNSMFILF